MIGVRIRQLQVMPRCFKRPLHHLSIQEHFPDQVMGFIDLVTCLRIWIQRAEKMERFKLILRYADSVIVTQSQLQLHRLARLMSHREELKRLAELLPVTIFNAEVAGRYGRSCCDRPFIP